MTLSYVFVMLAQVGALAHQNKLASDRVSNSVGAWRCRSPPAPASSDACPAA